jgi:hypothetical protein
MTICPTIECREVLLVFNCFRATGTGTALANEYNIAATSGGNCSNTSFSPLVCAEHVDRQ